MNVPVATTRLEFTSRVTVPDSQAISAKAGLQGEQSTVRGKSHGREALIREVV
jgi:hypothetical protein